jgi:hypothetical protein
VEAQAAVLKPHEPQHRTRPAAKASFLFPLCSFVTFVVELLPFPLQPEQFLYKHAQVSAEKEMPNQG